MTYAVEFNLKLDPACRFPDDLYWLFDDLLYNQNSLTAEQGNALENLYAQLTTLLEQQADPLQTLDEWLDARLIAPLARRLARLQARSLFACCTPDPYIKSC